MDGCHGARPGPPPDPTPTYRFPGQPRPCPGPGRPGKQMHSGGTTPRGAVPRDARALAGMAGPGSGVRVGGPRSAATGAGGGPGTAAVPLPLLRWMSAAALSCGNARRAPGAASTLAPSRVPEGRRPLVPRPARRRARPLRCLAVRSPPRTGRYTGSDSHRGAPSAPAGTRRTSGVRWERSIAVVEPTLRSDAARAARCDSAAALRRGEPRKESSDDPASARRRAWSDTGAAPTPGARGSTGGTVIARAGARGGGKPGGESPHGRAQPLPRKLREGRSHSFSPTIGPDTTERRQGSARYAESRSCPAGPAEGATPARQSAPYVARGARVGSARPLRTPAGTAPDTTPPSGAVSAGRRTPLRHDHGDTADETQSDGPDGPSAPLGSGPVVDGGPGGRARAARCRRANRALPRNRT